MTVDETQTESEPSRVDDLQEFAREQPYFAFGVLLVPVVYALNGDPVIALFTGGIVAFGKSIADGFNELGDDENGGGDTNE
jgi:hypothetical protein